MSGEIFRFDLLLVCLAAAGLYSLWYAFKSWAKNRLVEDTPTSRVRSAAQGYIELIGRGVAPEKPPIRGPLTGMTCAWWRYKIEDGGWGRRRRSTVDSGTSETPFLLDDGSGRCLIDPRGAEVFPGVTTVWYGPDAWPQGRVPNAPGILGWLLASLSTGRYRYTEHRLQANEPLYAIGEFRSLGGVGVDDPEAAEAKLLHEWKQNQSTLLARFDTNHDGKLSAAEWQEARAAAHKEIIDGRCAAAVTPAVNVLADPMDGRAFLLAAADGESLARRLRIRALAGLSGFVASSAALAWILMHV
jgi:hypothetical protein